MDYINYTQKMMNSMILSFFFNLINALYFPPEIPQMAGISMLIAQMENLVTQLIYSLLLFHAWDRNVLWCFGLI